MLDNDLYVLMRQWLAVEAPRRGVTPCEFKLRFQPLHTGRPDERTVYMHVIGYRRIGQRGVKQVPTLTGIQRTETQSRSTTLQFSVTQPLELDDDTLTHGDVMNLIAASMQGEPAIEWFRQYGVSFERVTDVRQIYVNNDRDQNEENPSFDLVVKHNDIYVDAVPQITLFNFDLARV